MITQVQDIQDLADFLSEECVIDCRKRNYYDNCLWWLKEYKINISRKQCIALIVEADDQDEEELEDESTLDLNARLLWTACKFAD